MNDKDWEKLRALYRKTLPLGEARLNPQFDQMFRARLRRETAPVQPGWGGFFKPAAALGGLAALALFFHWESRPVSFPSSGNSLLEASLASTLSEEERLLVEDQSRELLQRFLK